jgi:predicted RNA binding protein YcfA (HicA-like mRNA interferase family)
MEKGGFGRPFCLRFCSRVYSTHMNSAALIRLLRAEGWELDRVRGSHHVFKHPSRPGLVVVPHPKKDLGKGLVAAICKAAGVKL